MNRRQMIKAFPALVAAASAAVPARTLAQAVSAQTPKPAPSYPGRLKAGVVAMSFRPEFQSVKITYEAAVRFTADLGLEGFEATGYWLPPMQKFPPGLPSTQVSEIVRQSPANPSPQWLASLRNVAYKNGVH